MAEPNPIDNRGKANTPGISRNANEPRSVGPRMRATSMLMTMTRGIDIILVRRIPMEDLAALFLTSGKFMILLWNSDLACLLTLDHGEIHCSQSVAVHGVYA